jgi:metallophosphoesterase superfamily enzyme
VSKTTQVLDYPPAKASAETVRFAVVSDTHTHHRLIDIPPADVLIMCGDLTFLNESAAERLRDLNMWLATLPHKRKIIIGGNHDRILPTLTIETKRDTTFCNGTYLEFSATEVDGSSLCLMYLLGFVS